MANTYITEIEQVVDEVSSWAVTQINDIVKALAPDGRAFGTQPKPTEQVLAEYRLMRNDPMAWEAWGRQKALEITNSLLETGTSQDAIEALNPLNVASIMLLDYSSKMEILLESEMV